jgi:DNA-binding CsgD family transcriptional regulator
MLVGRERELATIDDLFAGAGEQSPFVLGVVGAAGSGRSVLADRARRIAIDHGALVLAARGSTDGANVAFAGLLTLLRPLQKDLHDLAGDLADPLRAALSMRRDRVDILDVRLAVLRVLTSAAESQTIAVVIDDADQVDAATIDSLRFAFGQLGVDRVGAVATSLSSTAPFDAIATHRITLGPMRNDHLAQIVEQQLGCTGEVAATCATWAGGNPLAAIELARSLTDDERNGLTPLPPVPRPTSRVVESLQSELDALSEPAQRAVVVAAADRSGSVQVVLAALRALGERPDGLDEAEERGVVIVDDDRLVFRQDLLRSLAYRLVAASSRRAAHRALATALAEPQQAAERAFQLVASCAGPDEEVASMLELVASDALRRGAPAEAAVTFERAARLSIDPINRQHRLRRAATAHLDALAFDEAARLAEEAAESGSREALLLAIEAIERRDGPQAAMSVFANRPLPAVVRADLLLWAGRSEDARVALTDRVRGDDEEDELADVLRAAMTGDPTAHVSSSDTDALAAERRPIERGADMPERGGALARRTARRRLHVLARRGVSPPSPATVDELLAASIAAEVAGRRDEAIGACTRAAALLPGPSSALAAEVAARIESLERATPDPVLALLTPAERRVAEAVADGRTNREAADHLFLSVKTVDFHLQSVYRKLEVRSRTELAVRLARGGRE